MEETQISTPANDGAEETSQNVGHDNTQTPAGEPDANDNAAENLKNDRPYLLWLIAGMIGFTFIRTVFFPV